MKKVTILLVLFMGLIPHSKAQRIPFPEDDGQRERELIVGGSPIEGRLEYRENWISSTTMTFTLRQWTEVKLSVSNINSSGYSSMNMSVVLENNSIGQIYTSSFDYSGTESTKKLSPGNYTVSISPFETVIPMNTQSDPKPDLPPPLETFLFATVNITATKSISRPLEEYVLDMGETIVYKGVSYSSNEGNKRFLPFVAITQMNITALATSIYINQDNLNHIYLNIYKNPVHPEVVGSMLITPSDREVISPIITISEGTYFCELSLQSAVIEGMITSTSSPVTGGGLPIQYPSSFTIAISGKLPQGSQVEYSYDLSGNCTGRNVIILQSSAKLLEQEQKQEDLPIFEDKQVNVKIYPNPTRGQIKVEIPEFQYNEAVMFSIYDMSGRLYKNQKATESIVDLDLSSYSAGTYILRMNRNGKYSSWRIIKIN